MFTKVGSQIEIQEPSGAVLDWCNKNLVLSNPEYSKRVRMNLWLGNTPKNLCLYEVNGNTITVPYGCLRELLPMLYKGKVQACFRPYRSVNFGGSVPLYDYQRRAVEEMYAARYGILQSPAGSGKTQMGIALACCYAAKTLWITHTKDLLNQSYERARQYVDPVKLGTITEGMVKIGESITFATIQTLAKVDLRKYQDEWDVIIVDECHHVSGSPTTITMFQKVLNTLRARHKYGLSATVHRADGLIQATYALLGEVIYKVPDKDVAERVMKVTVESVSTGVGLSNDFLGYDGKIVYPKMISYLTELRYRNMQIVNQLILNRWHYNLILSERVEHLKHLVDLMPFSLKDETAVIDGKSKKEVREKALEDMRDGKIHFLFATYQLVKEGVDIPRLDRLYLTTPRKDYAEIVQSVGRVARVFPGKEEPIVYDYVDNFIFAKKSYQQRCAHYRKLKCDMK